jgi:hypothetical protein
MSRLHPQQWGEKQTIDIKSDWALLSEDERRRKADELIQMIRELREPPMQPPPLVYRPEEAPDEPGPGGSGWQPRPVAGSKGEGTRPPPPKKDSARSPMEWRSATERRMNSSGFGSPKSRMAAARGGRGFRRFEKLRALAGDTTPLSIASATARSHLGIGGAAEGEGPFDPPTPLREISCCRGSLYPCHATR